MKILRQVVVGAALGACVQYCGEWRLARQKPRDGQNKTADPRGIGRLQIQRVERKART